MCSTFKNFWVFYKYWYVAVLENSMNYWMIVFLRHCFSFLDLFDILSIMLLNGRPNHKLMSVMSVCPAWWPVPGCVWRRELQKNSSSNSSSLVSFLTFIVYCLNIIFCEEFRNQYNYMYSHKANPSSNL